MAPYHAAAYQPVPQPLAAVPCLAGTYAMTDSTRNGRRMASRIPCPKCRHPLSKVLRTGEDDDGIVTRERRCPSCGYQWFTAQEPEWIVPRAEVRWPDGKPRWQEKTDPATPTGSVAFDSSRPPNTTRTRGTL